jgi:hypothetical protein
VSGAKKAHQLAGPGGFIALHPSAAMKENDHLQLIALAPLWQIEV